MNLLPRFIHRLRLPRPSENARTALSILLRDIAKLSLLSLAIALSFESILPGTVSVRYTVIFFVFGSVLALLIEQRVGAIRKMPPAPSRSRRIADSVLLVSFLMWAAFVFGNALIGFRLEVVLALLVITFPLLGALILWRNTQD